MGHGPASGDICKDAGGPACIGRIRRGEQECLDGPHHAIQLDRRALCFTAECVPTPQTVVVSLAPIAVEAPGIESPNAGFIRLVDGRKTAVAAIGG